MSQLHQWSLPQSWSQRVALVAVGQQWMASSSDVEPGAGMEWQNFIPYKHKYMAMAPEDEDSLKKSIQEFHRHPFHSNASFIKYASVVHVPLWAYLLLTCE